MWAILGMIVILGSWVGGAYVGGWLMFVKPIMDCCKAFDAGTLTALMVGVSIIKCFFAGAVGGLIAYIGSNIGVLIGGKK